MYITRQKMEHVICVTSILPVLRTGKENDYI